MTNNLSVLHYWTMTEQLLLNLDMSEMDPKQLVMDFTDRYQNASEEVMDRFNKDKEEYGY